MNMAHTSQTVDGQSGPLHHLSMANLLLFLLLCEIVALSGCVIPGSKAHQKERPEAPPGFMVVMRPGADGGTWALVKIPTKKETQDESVTAPSTEEAIPSIEETPHQDIERDLLERLNALRIDADVPPLQPHPSLHGDIDGICDGFQIPEEAGVAQPTTVNEGDDCLFATSPVSETDSQAAANEIFESLLASPRGKEANMDPRFQYVGFSLIQKDGNWHLRQRDKI